MDLPFNIQFRRWFYSTVVVGALPLIVRVITRLLLTVDGAWFKPVDFVFLGLTLSLTNINELNSLKNNAQTKLDYQEDSVWWSVFIILLLTFVLGIEYVGECMEDSIINYTAVSWISVLFAGISVDIPIIRTGENLTNHYLCSYEKEQVQRKRDGSRSPTIGWRCHG